MKKPILFFLTVLFATIIPCNSRASERNLPFGKFGTIHIYQPSGAPKSIVLFLSGDEGWNARMQQLALTLLKQDDLVAGIDTRSLKQQMEQSQEKCSYLAADLEALSKYLQKSIDLKQYKLPVLIGYSSGSTLVYATLAQSPPNTFAGGISIGFCPGIDLTKQFCKGSGLQWELNGNQYTFLPDPSLDTKWIVFQDDIVRTCDHATAEQFVSKTQRAELIDLKTSDAHHASLQNTIGKLELAQESQNRQAKLLAPDVQDLPLIELKTSKSTSDSFAVLLTGDGGWANIDRQIGNYLQDKGLDVVGFNSLQYFWKPRTPDSSSQDLERVLRHYMAAFHKDRFLLIGYSLGADVLVFMANRLPADLRERITLIGLLGPSQSADFEFHLTDWLGIDSSNARPTMPEAQKLKSNKMLCFFGEKETDSLCNLLTSRDAVLIPQTGGHHLGGDYKAIADRILAETK